MILPWCVDVPQDRWPVANWLIVLAAVAVFVLQIAELSQGPVSSGAGATESSTPGITGRLLLDGWELSGLFGYMWLHGGLFHLLGNMWFLWIFGNAVCAKVGNWRYLLLYVLLGVAAGVTHLVFDGGAALGASGAVNGIVGMYLVLFFENSITCYWAPILIYWRQFTVSSFWMILMWLAFDVYGALRGGAGVAYFAHLGGFGAGFAITWVMCQKGWITMERYEKSLWQWWQQHRAQAGIRSADTRSIARGCDIARSESPPRPPEQRRGISPVAKPVPPLSLREGTAARPGDGRLRVGCSCGRTLRLSAQYAGQTVRCPQCRAEVAVPRAAMSRAKTTSQQRATGDDCIRLTCTCGKRIKVPARFAGRSGRCPQCGARVRVPHAGP